MAPPDALGRLVRDVSRQIRWRRAEHYALRATFYGALVGVAVLCAKSKLDPWGPALAVAGVVLAALVGAIIGCARRVRPGDAAQLADREFGLQDRVATTLEWAARPDRTPLVDALVADTERRVGELRLRRIVRRILPPETRLLPIPVAVALILVLAPPVRLPFGRLPDFSAGKEDEQTTERTAGTMLEQTTRAQGNDVRRRPLFEERDFMQRGASGGPGTAGDTSAVFKDTSLAKQHSDFNSFLKKGDDRLRMLEKMDKIPDLQSDFTSSEYRTVMQKVKGLRSGLSRDVSPEKMRELLDEMERLGRKNQGNWNSDAQDAMDAFEGGQQDRALDAMERALNKMRAAEDAQRSGKNLKGGRDEGGRSGERGRGQQGGRDDQDFGEGEGSLPGKGKSGAPKGEATQRLRANPYDVGVEGEMRKGKKEGVDTNMSGRGGQVASRLQYLGVIGQYRKMMEDAITREAVPRDYHAQIKDYFQALDER